MISSIIKLFLYIFYPVFLIYKLLPGHFEGRYLVEGGFASGEREWERDWLKENGPIPDGKCLHRNYLTGEIKLKNNY